MCSCTDRIAALTGGPWSVPTMHHFYGMLSMLHAPSTHMERPNRQFSVHVRNLAIPAGFCHNYLGLLNSCPRIIHTFLYEKNKFNACLRYIFQVTDYVITDHF